MRILIFIFIIAFNACSTNHKTIRNTHKSEPIIFTPQFIPGPQALIYKTKSNYNNLVPVLLSEDKSEIISYPHPSDIIIDNSYPLPTNMNKGYLLDNRGIGINVAFLKMTYEEYSKLKNAPSLKELYDMILDKEPLTELCNCGNKNAYPDIIPQINKAINENKLRAICKTIK